MITLFDRLRRLLCGVGSAPPVRAVHGPYARRSRARSFYARFYGGAEPRLTSGGKAELRGQ